MKIKNCPFCGGEATITEGIRNDGIVTFKTKYVQCVRCGAKTQEKISNGYYGLYCTDEEISELWNTRKPIDKVVEQLEKIEVSRSEYSEIVECNIEPCTSTNCCECVVNKAIEIVKKGGNV